MTSAELIDQLETIIAVATAALPSAEEGLFDDFQEILGLAREVRDAIQAGGYVPPTLAECFQDLQDHAQAIVAETRLDTCKDPRQFAELMGLEMEDAKRENWQRRDD